MPRILDLDNEEHYKEWRSIRGIGSSDASAIMGVDKWSTPYSTWELKTRRRGYTPANKYMQRGIDLEPVALKEFEFAFGDAYPKTRMVHDDYPFIRAEFDGWNQELNVGVEIKVAGKDDHGLALQGLVPPHYIPRLDHLLMISGGEKVAYCSFNEDDGNQIVWYKRDQKAIDKLLKAELAFWDYIQKDDPPPLTLRDYNLREDDSWSKAATDYLHWSSIVEQASASLDAAKQSLMELANGQSTMGHGVRVLTYTKKGNIAYKKVADELTEIMGETVDLEKYRGPMQTINKVSAL